MSEISKPSKQIVILSGKGGTGKTSLAASLMHLVSQSDNSGVFVDADVDAANLALVTGADAIETHPFMGGQSAEIDKAICNRCSHCYDVCRFNAIHKPTTEEESFTVQDILCEGCAACLHACPVSAIKMISHQDGEWFHSSTPFGHLFHAELFPGAENTGKLVTIVRQNAKLYAEDHNIPLMIIDGPPGIGCPVISASAGADLALLVAEPGVSGIHDLLRIMQTINYFNIPIVISINKANLYPEGTQMIRELAKSHDFRIVGEIPFDEVIPHAIVNAQPVSLFAPTSQAALAITTIWKNIQQILFEKGAFS